MAARDPATVDVRRELRCRRALAALAFCSASLAGRSAGAELPAPRDLKALSRQLRVDLVWREDASPSHSSATYRRKGRRNMNDFVPGQMSLRFTSQPKSVGPPRRG